MRRLSRPIRRICRMCGETYESWQCHELYCPDCKGAAYAACYQRSKAKKARKNLPLRELLAQPDLTLREYNRQMRAKGLTYGGRPIQTGIYPREPKFLQGVKTRWTKSGGDWR